MPVPLATYRVQMRAEFGFDDAAAILYRFIWITSNTDSCTG